MAKKENTTSIGFEEKIWRAADMLRGNLDASEYKRRWRIGTWGYTNIFFKNSYISFSRLL